MSLKLASDRFNFGDFTLDAGERRLLRDGATVELNARYLDALVLLVREHGQLVTKERFLEEVWRGVPVTDEALTQGVRTLRRALGDDAVRPRFIETVPKHGYRFVAPVERVERTQAELAPAPAASSSHPVAAPWRKVGCLGAGGLLGGGAGGAVGGLFYSLLAAPAEGGMGSASMLLVLVCLTALIGVIGGAGVSFGIAAALTYARRRVAVWNVAGGAGGGLAIGAIVKLLALDAFHLLFGRSPGDITGGEEGVLLGAAAGLAVWAASRAPPSARLAWGVAAGALTGAVAGVLVSLLGGRLLAGSLDLLARRFPDSRLEMAPLGGVFGERDFGLASQLIAGGVEGLLFVSFVVGGLMLARRRLEGS